MLRRIVFAVTVLLGWSAMAAAQDGTMLWVEGGKQNSEFGNGLTRGGGAGGAGIQLIIGGGAKRQSGLIVPVGMELKVSQGMDWVFSGDIGMRVRNLSFGPGLTFNLMSRSFVDDPWCGTSQPAFGSCVGRTQRDVGGYFGLAPSGFVKVSFGPQGRAFMQARYFKYASGFLSYLSDSELRDKFNVLASTLGSDTQLDQPAQPFHPVDFPEFKGGRDLRVSVGYVSGKTGHILLRAQYSDRQFDFTRVLANTNGLFDQHSKQITFGIGFR